MIRGQTREIEKPSIKLDASIHNRFDIEVIDAETGKVKQSVQAENVILNSLWLNFSTTWSSYILYGSGSGTPAATDTGLFSFIAGKASTSYSSGLDANNRVYSRTVMITISETEAVGKNISEVGLGYGTSNSNLVTHAMLKDMNGNDITILKTDTDIIKIYATVFIHYSTQSDGVTLAGIPPIAYGAGKSSDYYVAFYMCNGKRTGYSGETYNIWPSWDSTTKKLVFGTIRLGANDGVSADYGGISCINSCVLTAFVSGEEGNWYTPNQITGEAVGTGDGTTKEFSLAFNFPTNATILVDGVAATGVTVNCVPKTTAQDPCLFLTSIDQYGNPWGVAYANIGYNSTAFYYNRLYQYGIASITKYSGNLYMSDNLTDWVQVASGNTTSSYVVTIPEAYRNYKYLKFVGTNQSATYNQFWGGNFESIPKQVVFSTAPASGAVITANYTPKCIAKDANHVFDFSATIQFGEYTT